MVSTDRDYFIKRVNEEITLAICVPGAAGGVHRMMAEEYQRRIDMIDATSAPSAVPLSP